MIETPKQNPTQSDQKRIKNTFPLQNLCPNMVCHLNVTYLQSCTVHTFDLTPFFAGDAGFTAGSTLTTSESTLGTGKWVIYCILCIYYI